MATRRQRSAHEGADADDAVTAAIDTEADAEVDADAGADVGTSARQSTDTDGGTASAAAAAALHPPPLVPPAARPVELLPSFLRARIQSLLPTAAAAGQRPLAAIATRLPPPSVAHVYRRGPGLAPALACRLPHVCLDAAGTLSLPPGWQWPLVTVVAAAEPPPGIPSYDVDRKSRRRRRAVPHAPLFL